MGIVKPPHMEYVDHIIHTPYGDAYGDNIFVKRRKPNPFVDGYRIFDNYNNGKIPILVRD